MSNKKLGTEPAFPLSYEEMDDLGIMYSMEEFGISKRLWIATQIAANLFTEVIKTANNFPGIENKNVEEVVTVSLAYKVADELLKQENE